MTYESARSGPGQRSIDPYGLELGSDRAYVHGWCHRRNALHTFRIDRIEALTVTATRFRRDEAAWERFRGQVGVFNALRGGEPVAARLRFSPEVALWARESYRCAARSPTMGASSGRG